jgi:hypothetical protein
LPNFTDELQFRFPWRSYQATYLKNLDKHITDKHLHLIAPPGSGKTILGIEIVRRINKKTLVLAPTLTIRNQWKDRLHTFFTEENSFESVSFDLKIQEAITFSTYQSIHAFFKSFKDKAAFFDFFHHHSIECIVLDEALGKIKNPRYLLIVKSWWRKLLKIEQLYAVPDIFGDRKENSLLFQYHWRRNLGKANVVFTRNPEGRKLLVKARIAHISNIFKKENRKAVIWR